eukprot:CAMPEP_0198245044 /NCGR_PEP_ID=MMETSP1446-20131203/38826_1 /TAXON_ID=1461542 ORGANISM="Unidentified sp, Strain CCMP2111" /NCGR_SAMPLE_ID=MMETSP1446 /ASSEMBLY_ACC=CAM_ASM_001112 /LENGTH=144 /DNA_ID=CAMNT_0043929169 /DNA_START=32 /DNA_END=463 /DNA_ORIENTATION=-
MSPCIVTGALCGIGFGALNAVKSYVAPSISPALSSLVMMVSIVLLRHYDGAAAGQMLSTSQGVLVAGKHLAVAFLFGSLSQLLLQSVVMHRKGVGRFMRFRLQDQGKKQNGGYSSILDIARVLVPATIASTMLQLATYTDLYFA